MRAKLRAQIDTGAILSARTRAPAATSRPAMVSISGRPAAIRLPNATARMVKVTGQESSSERIMAERLALLKFAHRALSPVKVTVMPDVPSLATGPARDPAAVTIALGPAAAPAVTIPVCPSLDSETPCCGATTVETRRSARSIAVTLPRTLLAAGSVARGA